MYSALEVTGMIAAAPPAAEGCALLASLSKFGDPNLSGDQRKVERWFNTDAFVVQPFGTLGTAGRNVLTGPGTNIVDFSLLKNIPLNEHHRLQFRAEFFNFFNNTNFDFPERICTATVTGSSCTGGTFGRITAARDPRILQFGLKYLF